MPRCCRWDWLVRPGDTLDEGRIKTLMFPFALFLFLFAAGDILFTYLGEHIGEVMTRIIGIACIMFANALFLAGVLPNVVSAPYLLDAWLVISTAGLCAVDLGDAALSSGFRSWTLIVLLLDCALLFKREHIARCIIIFVLFYYTIVQTESVLRFGLYDVGYWGSAGVEDSYCNCASPPCRRTPVDAFFGLVAVCIVLLGDFQFTRKFATGMRLQLRRVEASVDVAGVIADALARYD
eukprot:Hpha_TRINITY_DN16088_c7_g2::TRINITY_DN16088_c7_g2_i3::g.121594::m.121594